MSDKKENKQKDSVNKKDVDKKEIVANTSTDKQLDDNEIIPEEILEAIPVEERGKFVSMVRQTMISSVSKRGNPITEKITPEHITTLIDNSNVTDKRDREERKSERNYNLILIVIGLIFVSFLVIFLTKKDQSLLITIITAILSFIGGFGFGKSQK